MLKIINLCETMVYDVIVIGAGAAGCFFAINYKEKHPDASVLILEKSNKPLAKLKISGGGRCNVTHACFDPRELVKYYPRGQKELMGPFNSFQPGDTIAWFAERGVELKIEEDGRMFPTTDSSQTIIDTFLGELEAKEVKIYYSCGVDAINYSEDGVHLDCGEQSFKARNIFLATGGTPSMWKVLNNMGIDIVDPVPALFTFNISSKIISDLPGVSCPNTRVKIVGTKLEEFGPTLITHWGLSGPGILKLSSVAAILLHTKKYKFKIEVNWNIDYEFQDVIEVFKNQKEIHPKQKVWPNPLVEMPKRLWKNLCAVSGISEENNYADVNKKQIVALANLCTNCSFDVNGKSTNKDEFVSAGGVGLKQVDFKRMNLKQFPRVYLAGEVLNIDALTGGFNFQNAWTGAWIASQNME